MLSKVFSATLFGPSSKQIIIEVDSQRGLPAEHIVGLPDAVIRESKNRIKSAIKNSSFKYPLLSYTINLAPAEFPKEGPLLDLPIALAILLSTSQLSLPKNVLAIGELSLDGTVKPVRGCVAICQMTKKMGFSGIIVPKDNENEAALIEGIDIYPLKRLGDIHTLKRFTPKFTKIPSTTNALPQDTFDDVKGQILAKRALEIAAAGKHNILLIGPPGSGKTMLLKRLPSILPDLDIDKAIETFSLLSINSHADCLSLTPPLRAPHHTTSYAGMIGGGRKPKPGEISLAHNGLLFLDELPEFQRSVLESLRQPLEEHIITISRAQFSVTFPADIMLIATMNPCPCGYHKDGKRQCLCTSSQIQHYLKRLSGPILDRIDMMVHVPRLKKSDLMSTPASNPYTSNSMASKVLEARKVQYARFGRKETNSRMSSKEMALYANIDNDSLQFLSDHVDKGLLTGRSYTKILKLSRTIADLNTSEIILLEHVLEAVQYRSALMTELVP
jgi:magnesium chelatase family protein